MFWLFSWLSLVWRIESVVHALILPEPTTSPQASGSLILFKCSQVFASFLSSLQVFWSSSAFFSVEFLRPLRDLRCAGRVESSFVPWWRQKRDNLGPWKRLQGYGIVPSTPGPAKKNPPGQTAGASKNIMDLTLYYNEKFCTLANFSTGFLPSPLPLVRNWGSSDESKVAVAFIIFFSIIL